MTKNIHGFLNFLFRSEKKNSKSENINTNIQTVTKTEVCSAFEEETGNTVFAAEYNFERMCREGSSFYITKPKTYTANHVFKQETILKIFDFAYNMSFGKKGKHRDHRSGGNHRRKNGEVFANAYQGKLAECAVYNKLYKCGEIREIDFNTYELGRWDDADIIVNGKSVAVKSTKFFGNLLLLETQDWNSKGQYIPNIDTDNSVYDYVVSVRIKPNCEELLKQIGCYYSDKADYSALKNLILSHTWEYNIAGYITQDELIYIIRQKYIIPQGTMLNGRTRMDASNYYIQLGDFHSIDELSAVLKKKMNCKLNKKVLIFIDKLMLLCYNKIYQGMPCIFFRNIIAARRNFKEREL